MKKYLIAAIIMTMCMAFAGCGSTSEEPAETETTAAAETEATNEAMTDTQANSGVVKKEISDVDENTEPYLELGIDEIKLMEDGTLMLEADGALEDAVGEDVTIANDVADVFVVPFGNGGFRSVIFIREDGSVSALSAEALINNHSIEVMDNLGGLTDVKTIEGMQDVDAFGVNAVLNSGDTVMLDPYLK